MASSMIAYSALVLLALACAADASACPTCTLAQCEHTACNAVNPYVCLTGVAAGSCSNNASAWNNTVLCTSCCDAAACSALPRFQCNRTCSAAMCHSARRCPQLTPFMCTAGKAEYGCSASSKYWPTSPTCTECCDIRSCEETCPTCTSEQCQANPCAPATPYTCTAGPLKNACSNSSTYFGTQSQCYSCCDSSNCSSSRFSCDAAPCPQSVCRSTSRCSLTMQYMCIDGNSTDGCSSSSSYWPSYPGCSNCCNVASCEFTCPPCTAAQCTGNPCTPWDPYVCTAGPLANGCSGDPTYFGQQSQCYSCCDASACPSK